MKRLLPVPMGFALLLLSSTTGWSLPPCPGSYDKTTWTDCVGKTILETGTPPDNIGDEYEGEFQNGKPHGEGTLRGIKNSKYKYLGQWKNGRSHGKGTSTYADGSKYVGEWMDDTKNGQGTLTYADGTKYDGGYKDGKKHGLGTETYPNGDEFVGDWRDDYFHGEGTYTYGPESKWAGDKYVGEFKFNEYHGYGTHTYANGDKYVGEWTHDTKNGQGTLTYADGSKYVGQFKNNKREGLGTYIYPNGNKYVGDWMDGNKHGEGTYRDPDGNQYSGQWENGLPNGLGIHTYKDGKVEEGMFEKGKFLDTRKLSPTVTARKALIIKEDSPPPCPKYGYWNNCIGTYASADGTKYVGEFMDGKYHGRGTETSADGKTKEGLWENNKFLDTRKPSPTVTARKAPIIFTKIIPAKEKIIPANETSRKKSNNTNPDPVTYKSTWNNCIGFIWHGSGCLRNQVR
jgi:hypothetical protein